MIDENIEVIANFYDCKKVELPIYERFDNGLIPNCWTVEGNDWNFASIGNIGNIEGPYLGRFNAYFFGKNSVSSKLISPKLNMTNYSNVSLRFWHAQESWDDDQDELRVYYKTSTTGDWIRLNSYTSNIVNWTERVIELPNLTNDYYIAFEAIGNYGYGVIIDNISLEGVLEGNIVADFFSSELFSTIDDDIIFSDGTRGQGVERWFWNFGEGANPATASTQGPHTVSYSTPGLKTVSLTINDTVEMIKENYITISDGCAFSLPYEEKFETEKIPYCWAVEGDEWMFYLSGNNNGEVSEANTGNFNAVFYSPSGIRSMLISPRLKLREYDSVSLEFWHTQELWEYDQDELRVFYKNSTNTDWILLEEYTQNIVSWTKRIINLPNLTDDYYIAFEAFGNYGFGVTIDDISITGLVNIADSIVVDFISADTNIVVGEVISFADASMGDGIEKWFWNFGEGASPATATSQGPHSVTYSTCGFKNVSLTVNDSLVESKINFVSVIELNNELIYICENSDYTFADGTFVENITEEISHTSTIILENGCESLITTELFVMPVLEIEENIEICHNSSFTFYDGELVENITEDFSHTSVLVSSHGCDSLVVTNISVIPIEETIENVEVCHNSSFTFYDGELVENITEDFSHTSVLVSSHGCDSLVVTNILVIPIEETIENVEVCQNSSFTFYDGELVENITEDFSHTSVLVSSHGCDSLVVTNISVIPIEETIENVEVCQNSSFTFYDGELVENITEDFSHTSVLVSSHGCDSLVVTNISVIPIIKIVQNMDICYKSDFTFPDGNTVNNIMEPIIYISTFQLENSCDSIVETILTIKPTYSMVDSVEICKGDDYTFSDGTVIPNILGSMSHTSYLTSINMCDSIINTYINTTIIDTDIEVINNVLTAISPVGEYQWINCGNNSILEGNMNQSYSPSRSGSYAVIISRGGCTDTSVCENIIISDIESIFEFEINVFPNPFDNFIIIEIPNNSKMLNFEIINSDSKIMYQGEIISKTIINTNKFVPGNYFLKFSLLNIENIKIIKSN
jgi:PKD repeat protein